MTDSAVKAPPSHSNEHEGVNVQVLLRCRPLSDKEIAERTPQVISCNETLREATLYQNVGGKQMSRTFRFDKVFGCDSTQEKLYKQAIIPIVEEVMEGFNCTIFAYGQTGTGKTYTMEGGPRRSDDGKALSAEAGVIPRAIKQIFDHIDASGADSTVKVSFLELYNEELTDLLSTSDPNDDSKRLRLLEDRSGVVAQGLEEMIVKSATEIYQVLDRGTAKRRTAETLLNKRSSRSHSVFSITIHMREVTPEGEDVVKVGKLNLVDLAGSENISRSGAKDGRAREAGSINQSLLTLGRVITALVEHSGHVPYRDSKLTRLLRESLGGKTKTCIIATIAPTVQCQEETISTLDYAHRAKNIRNRPEVNQKISKTTMIKEMSSEMDKLRMELIAQREKNGVYVPVEQYQQDELERIQLRDTVKALREELKAEQESAAEALEKQKVEAERIQTKLQSELASTKTELAKTNRSLHDALSRLHERQYMLDAHRKAEQHIVEHAEGLQSELSAAARDIEGLFGSLQELTGLHSEDRDAMQRIQQLTAARLADLSSSLAGAVDAHCKQLLSMSDTLAAFKVQKEQELQRVTSMVKAAQDSVAAMQSTVSELTKQADANSAAILSGASTASGTYAAGAAAAVQALEGAARTALDTLSSSIEQQVQQLSEFAAQQAASAEECRARIGSAMQRVSGRMASAGTLASQAVEASDERLTALQDKMAVMASQQADSIARKQVQVVAQMTALMQAFAAECSSEIRQGVAGLKEEACGISVTARRELNGITEVVKGAMQDAEEEEKAMVSGLQQHQSHSAEHAARFATSLQASKEQAGAVRSGVAQQTQQIAAAADIFGKDMASYCNQGTATMQGVLAAGTKATGEAASRTCGMQDELQAALDGAAVADNRAADSLSATCAATSSSLTATTEQHSSGLTVVVGRVEALLAERIAMQRQAPVPDQRKLNVPAVATIHNLRCDPEATLLARCHSEYPQLFAEPSSASSPRDAASRQTSEGSLGSIENATPLPPVLSIQSIQGGGSVPPSPRPSTSGLRSRIPGKPSGIPNSPAAMKDAPSTNAAREKLADRTNSTKSILADWPAA